MTSGVTTVVCTRCGTTFKGGFKRKYCPECEKIVSYTCPDCGGPKRTKYSTWCYHCSLNHRRTANNIEIAMQSAQTPEARAKRIASLQGHEVSAETRQKIGAANVASGHLPAAGRKGGRAGKGKKKPEHWTEAQRERMTGSNNPSWIDGTAAAVYGSDWTEELKESIRERDGRICHKCGKSREKEGKRLTIHHIDGDKHNQDSDNLITLCSSCHRGLHNTIRANGEANYG